MNSVDMAKLGVFRAFFNCLLQYKKWRVARAYNTVVCDLLRSYDYSSLAEKLRARGYNKWAEIHGAEKKLEDTKDHKLRCSHLEIELDAAQRRITQLDIENTLLKKTAKNLANLRRQRSFPLETKYLYEQVLATEAMYPEQPIHIKVDEPS